MHSPLQGFSLRGNFNNNSQSTTLSSIKKRFFNNKEQKIGQDASLNYKMLSTSLPNDRKGDIDKQSLNNSNDGLEYPVLNTLGNFSDYNKDLQIFEAKLIELLPLPSFLLTIEEFNKIPEP